MADLYNVVVLFVPRVDDRDVKIVVKVSKSGRLCHVGRTLGSAGTIVHQFQNVWI